MAGLYDEKKNPTVNVDDRGSHNPDALENGTGVPNMPMAGNTGSSMDDWWLWEIGGLVGSLLCLGAVILMLGLMDGKPLPTWAVTTPDVKWRHGKTVLPSKTLTMSLNSVVSWITTVAKICLLIPITKGLGQLKWVWFAKKDRVLSDLETFENATRGISGSALLVWKLKGRHFAAIGAIAMLLSLAFEPFLQNLIVYSYEAGPSPSYFDASAIVTANRNYTVKVLSDNDDYDNIDVSMKAFLSSALYDALDTLQNDASQPTWGQPLYNCYTGHCYWEMYPSIGVEAQCTDITDKLIRNCTADPYRDVDYLGGCDYSLPNGFSLHDANGTRSGLMRMNTTKNSLLDPLIYKYPTDMNKIDSSVPTALPLAIIQTIAADIPWPPLVPLRVTQNVSVIASECILLPAVKVYSAEVATVPGNPSAVENPVAKPQTLVISAATLNETLQYTYDNFLWSYPDGVILIPPENKTANIKADDKFGIDYDSYIELITYINKITSGYVTSEDGHGAHYYNDYAQPWSMEAIFTNVDYTCDDTTPVCSKPALAISNMALAMSKAMRDYPFAQAESTSVTISDLVKAGSLVVGTTLLPQEFMRVAWVWLVLPACLWILTAMFTIGVITRTRRAGIRTWRTNPLAMVFLDLDHQTEQTTGGRLTEDELSKQAERLKVRLHTSNDGVRLARNIE